MRALNAQRAALEAQIRQEATSIAAALESEAKIDDAQITLLQSQLASLPATIAADTSGLEAKASAQRTELDALVDAYFDIPTSASAAPASPMRDLLHPMNLAVVAITALVALVLQFLLAVRRRRTPIETDMKLWDEDADTVPTKPAAEPHKQAA
jgi:hypothetical protein